MWRMWGVVVAVLSGLLTVSDASWSWPVAHAHAVVRAFDAPDSPWGPGHRGIDLAAKKGDLVLAPVSGTIHFSGRVVDRGIITIKTGNGDLVSIEPVEATVTSGSVKAGERIGRVGAGHCAGGCLHIGLRVQDEYRSPAQELGVLTRAVLIG
jgi:murein DD-endopeptidase MepM/ murein hydrolase activator NlpD